MICWINLLFINQPTIKTEIFDSVRKVESLKLKQRKSCWEICQFFLPPLNFSLSKLIFYLRVMLKINLDKNFNTRANGQQLPTQNTLLSIDLL